MAAEIIAPEVWKQQLGLVGEAEEPYDEQMEPVSRPELDAKLEAIEARMDARVASIEGKIDTMLARLDGRDQAYEQRFISLDKRFAGVEESLKETRAAIGNLKTTTIVTAVSAVLAIILGVAAFNATVLSNMVASFESGKNTAASIERTAQEMKALQDRLDRQPSKQ